MRFVLQKTWVCLLALGILLSPAAGLGAKKPKASYRELHTSATRGIHCDVTQSLMRALAQEDQAFKNLDPRMRRFLEDSFLPVVGRRGLEAKPGIFRACEIASRGACFDLDTPADIEKGFERLRFVFSDETKVAHFDIEKSPRTLYLPLDPKLLEETPDHGANVIRRFLVGHILHPFMPHDDNVAARLALEESRLLIKDAQHEAETAIESLVKAFQNKLKKSIDAVRASSRKFLFVAPTGLGKTEVLMRGLKTQILEGSQHFHILTADRINLTNQLRKDLHGLEATLPTGKKMAVVYWNESHGKVKDLGRLKRTIEANKREGIHTVLVSTIQSISSTVTGRLQKGDKGFSRQKTSANWATLRQELGTLLIDEAHHTGAPWYTEAMKELVNHNNSKAFALGTTATPFHGQVDVIGDLFDDRAFWAYLDSAEEWLKNPGGIRRDFKEVLDQLQIALIRGELTDFQHRYYAPEKIADEGKELYVAAGKNIVGQETYALDPKYYNKVVKTLQPDIDKGKKGFIAVANVDEAEALLVRFREAYPHKKFETFHYKKGSQSETILENFRAGEIDYLICIEQLDEGINLPSLDTYIDLNRIIAPRKLLQRIGRVLRLSPGKTKANVVTMTEISQEAVEESIEFYERFGGQGFFSGLDDYASAGKKGRSGPSGRSGRGLGLSYKEYSLDDLERIRAELKETDSGIEGQLIDFWINKKRAEAKRRSLEERSRHASRSTAERVQEINQWFESKAQKTGAEKITSEEVNSLYRGTWKIKTALQEQDAALDQLSLLAAKHLAYYFLRECPECILEKSTSASDRARQLFWAGIRAKDPAIKVPATQTSSVKSLVSEYQRAIAEINLHAQEIERQHIKTKVFDNIHFRKVLESMIDDGNPYLLDLQPTAIAQIIKERSSWRQRLVSLRREIEELPIAAPTRLGAKQEKEAAILQEGLAFIQEKGHRPRQLASRGSTPAEAALEARIKFALRERVRRNEALEDDLLTLHYLPTIIGTFITTHGRAPKMDVAAEQKIGNLIYTAYRRNSVHLKATRGDALFPIQQTALEMKARIERIQELAQRSGNKLGPTSEAMNLARKVLKEQNPWVDLLSNDELKAIGENAPNVLEELKTLRKNQELLLTGEANTKPLPIIESARKVLRGDKLREFTDDSAIIAQINRRYKGALRLRPLTVNTPDQAQRKLAQRFKKLIEKAPEATWEEMNGPAKASYAKDFAHQFTKQNKKIPNHLGKTEFESDLGIFIRIGIAQNAEWIERLSTAIRNPLEEEYRQFSNRMESIRTALKESGAKGSAKLKDKDLEWLNDAVDTEFSPYIYSMDEEFIDLIEARDSELAENLRSFQTMLSNKVTTK